MSIPCEACCMNVVCGIVHKLPNGGYICNNCYEKINPRGEYYDGAGEDPVDLDEIRKLLATP